jgi:hypothetical protein
MLHWKSFGLVVFAAVCLLTQTTGSAQAQCNPLGNICATEWSDGSVINLGGLPSSTQSAGSSINDAGEVVGFSVVDGVETATEWNHDSVINLDQRQELSLHASRS